MPKPEPPRQPPPVQRLRLRYSKLGVARFASHRDFSRAFERALRRAEVPMAYSSGFSPHPRISYANAAPTSAESHAEYLDIALVEQVDADQLADKLNGALPAGFRIEQVIESSKPSLTELLQASEWTIDLGAVDADALRAAVEALLAAPGLEVSRRTKKGLRVFDVRPAVLAAHVEGDHIWVRLRHGVPLVRPDDLVTGLRQLVPGLGDDHPGLFARLRQGPLGDDGSIIDPLLVAAPSRAPQDESPTDQP
ncbi:TIGR03936 family radical SAM-associated protein [Propionibacterium freudenreichii]|uniref:TIGR03936 family radical SAM-associated protein n=1 Tax=Propionibacterium freudenreichii TaxID=1744 RepID=UPI0038549568